MAPRSGATAELADTYPPGSESQTEHLQGSNAQTPPCRGWPGMRPVVEVYTCKQAGTSVFCTGLWGVAIFGALTWDSSSCGHNGRGESGNQKRRSCPVNEK